MQYLAIIKIVLALLPSLIDAVKAIEAAFPVSGQGAAKLDFLRNVMETAYNSGSGAVAKFEDVWPVLQGTVTSVVAFLNSAGIFKK